MTEDIDLQIEDLIEILKTLNDAYERLDKVSEGIREQLRNLYPIDRQTIDEYENAYWEAVEDTYTDAPSREINNWYIKYYLNH